MSRQRHSSLGRIATDMARITMQQAAAQAREAERQARASEKVYQRDLREQEKQQANQELWFREENAAMNNASLDATIAGFQSLLSAALTSPRPFFFNALRQHPTHPPFDPGGLDHPEPAPQLAAYLPPPLMGVRKVLPGAKRQYERDLAQAHQRYNDDTAAHTARERQREQALAARRARYDATVREIDERAAADNAAVDDFQRAFGEGVPDAVETFCALTLRNRPTPTGFPPSPGADKIVYSPDSRQLVIEWDLPPFDVVPTVSSYKYVKATNQIKETAWPMARRKALYAGLIAQIVLLALHDVFGSGAARHTDTIVLNGYVDSIDAGTGQAIRPCLVTVRVTRDTWSTIDLTRVEPAACLKTLNAGVSKSPADLAAVRPVVELSMVDPRFIDQADVLSDLDTRPNLMDLTPNEFEALIANLFGKMGLETRLTQASRDGGVDCVAYNLDPVLGGKVVIQAKRYKHTVGVSAVRDLYGTVQNEGASKGILVTTSGYGKAAFDFAQNKPLTLFDGANLLYLLATHAGIEAKIEIPADWKDPTPDAAAPDA